VTAALVGLVVGGAQAQVTTEQSASILIFPKVIADGTRDTIIQLTNTGNSMVNVHCFYVNGALSFPVSEVPPGPSNPPLCTEVDFDFSLTKQQPTHWVVSHGRTATASALATQCANSPPAPYPVFDCNDAGLFTGQIPPVVDDPATGAIFTGELKCIEVGVSGEPLSGNHLKGEAEIETANVCDPDDGTCFIQGDTSCTTDSDCVDTFDVSKYNAIGIMGNENNNGDNVLCLGSNGTDQCSVAEYDACPAVWIANHYAEDAPDPVAGPESSVSTDWTFVPCTENFETQQPTDVTIQIVTVNEYEQPFSSNLTFSCWADLDLDDIGSGVQFDYTRTLHTTFAESRLRSATGTASGFLMIQSEEHETADDWESYADVNNHVEGSRTQGDTITIPLDQLSIGGTGPNP